jgi:nitrogen-specific signal transduction histidine kinase
LGRIDGSITEKAAGIEITVADNGRGVPDAIRATLFEPFVSQGKENGTGLGLTVVQKIVQDHGGEVAVERTSPEGTVFRVALPRPVPTVAVTEPGSSEDSVSAGSVDSTKRV